MSTIKILEADLDRQEHRRAVVTLLDAYAQDPMGNGQPLSADIRRDLIPGLQQHPTTIIFLAFQNDEAVGIATCFRGFSTFAARPLINISDFYVLPERRGQNIGQMILTDVETKARNMGCCKITLEVQENNHRARRIYQAAGFSRAVYVEAAGGALFLSKALQTG
ncbi:MAG: GNAT family N-acetyltransferase [Desulfobacterales bacterium]